MYSGEAGMSRSLHSCAEPAEPKEKPAMGSTWTQHPNLVEFEEKAKSWLTSSYQKEKPKGQSCEARERGHKKDFLN
ncbi:hypothetical protein Tco_0059773 [Tanacetum coccineum]